ncbi:uncharacterized protein LOC142814356 [Rhipicephalus microplus]|uniref:uncharacterized protein LOC142814356 n=1 Tax=Rhipicephalus microplus TaxID=6941 RepID=UPI003F6D240D
MAGFWRVASKAFVWITCTAGFLYQASDVLQLYLKHAFTVTVYKEHGSRQIRFPAVTVCTEKWWTPALEPSAFTLGVLKNEVLEWKEAPEGTDALAERLLFDPDLRNEAAYTPSELFNCHMRSQDDKCAAFSCVSMIRRTFYRTPFLMCYTFDLYQYAEPSHPFRSCEVPWLYELELTSEWDTLKTGPTDNVWRYPLIVHEPEICPPEKLAPIHLRQGMRYTVSIAQVCLQNCLIQHELGNCGCALPEHEFAVTTFKGYLCTEKRKNRCVKILPRDRNIMFCKQRCTLPCRSSFAAIIRFSTSSQTVYDYQRRLTGQEALAYIGGYIGMWLGISLYSVYVFLETSLTTFLRTRWHVFRHLVHR